MLSFFDASHLPPCERVTAQVEVKVGDLVVYKEPRRFFTASKGRNFIGVVTNVDYIHAKVFWQDGLWCLESLEDLYSFEGIIRYPKVAKP